MSFSFSYQVLARRLTILLCCLVCSATSLYAKAILYDGRDGLASNSITEIAKDNRGLMWIGTSNGLSIYDGYTFNKIAGELASVSINTLMLDSAHNEMLVGTKAGLYSVSLSTFRIKKFSTPISKNGGKIIEPIHDICLTSNGEIYVAIGDGMLATITAKRTLAEIFVFPGARPIRNIFQHTKGSLILQGDKLFLYGLNDNSIRELEQASSLAPFHSVALSNDLLLLSGYSSRFAIFNAYTFTEHLDKELHDMIRNLSSRVLYAFTKQGYLYLLCDNYSFYIIDQKKKTINNISKKYPDIFEGKLSQSIFVDEHDIIWIATNKGLIKVEERPQIFNKFLSNLTSRVSTRTIIEDEQEGIFIGSYSGLWNKSANSKDWTNYNTNTREVVANEPLAYQGTVQPLALLKQNDSKYYYVGFEYSRLLKFDKIKKVYERINYTVSPGSESINSIFCLKEDKFGIIWIGTGNGLASYNPATNNLTLHRNNAFDIGKSRVRYLYMDGDIMYVGTNKGFFKIDLEEGITKVYNVLSTPALSQEDVLFIDKDKEGRLWLGTNGGGVNIIAADGNSIERIRKQNGLSSDIVYSILPENETTVWISTFNGLDRYRKDKRSFNNFFEEDGLSSNEFNNNSFLKAKDGSMYFGSINGVTTFHPSQFVPPPAFSIFLSGISKWDDKLQSLKMLNEVVGQNNTIIKKSSDVLVELHFGITDYSDPLRNIYSYRVKEIANNWISLDERHTLNLDGLSPGLYTVEVKAINARGASSANTLTLKVKIEQPFYRTAWFYFLILLCIALIFYAAYWFKSQNFKNVLRLRMRIASNLHDEVGSLLTRITMFSDNLRFGKNTEEQRNEKLDKIGKLSRDAVASMSDVLWAIDSRNDFAGNLLDRMREQAEDMLLPLGMDVNFEVSGTDLKQPIGSDIRGEIYLIFKEAINNIAKHSHADRVEITYSIQDKNYLLRIRNNGATEAGEKQSTGQGLSNMEMRAKKIAAHIIVAYQQDWFSIEIKNG